MVVRAPHCQVPTPGSVQAQLKENKLHFHTLPSGPTFPPIPCDPNAGFPSCFSSASLDRCRDLLFPYGIFSQPFTLPLQLQLQRLQQGRLLHWTSSHLGL
jgi:hypothetical protein